VAFLTPFRPSGEEGKTAAIQEFEEAWIDRAVLAFFRSACPIGQRTLTSGLFAGGVVATLRVSAFERA
jgi:hypothetical protein